MEVSVRTTLTLYSDDRYCFILLIKKVSFYLKTSQCMLSLLNVIKLTIVYGKTFMFCFYLLVRLKIKSEY